MNFYRERYRTRDSWTVALKLEILFIQINDKSIVLLFYRMVNVIDWKKFEFFISFKDG